MSAFSDFLTQDTSPWWVPIATLGIGSVGTYFFSHVREGRALKIEDKRRFEQDILDQCVAIDRAVTDIHENNNDDYDDPEHGNAYNQAYYTAFFALQKAQDRLSLIGPRKIAEIASRARVAAFKLGPHYPGKDNDTMTELHECTVALRGETRRYLRIED